MTADLHTDLSHLLLELSSFLQIGHALPQALRSLATTSRGKLFCDYLLLPSEENSYPPLSFIKRAICLSQKNGMSLAPILIKFSDIVRLEQESKSKLKLSTLPLRIQAGIALCLPWSVTLMFFILDKNLVLDALSDRQGVIGFSTALLFQGGAWLWIRSILQKSMAH